MGNSSFNRLCKAAMLTGTDQSIDSVSTTNNTSLDSASSSEENSSNLGESFAKAYFENKPRDKKKYTFTPTMSSSVSNSSAINKTV